jgi:hypothetical protein
MKLVAWPALTALALVALGPPTSAAADTQRLRYSPIDADGTLRDGLRVISGGAGECTSGSFWVVDAFRCFQGSLIRDVCYLDERDQDAKSVLCARDPWAKTVAQLELNERADGAGGAKPGGLPWALKLASGARCVGASGATTVVQGYRLNYICGRFGTKSARYLFGSPDRSRSTWRIRQARTPEGSDLRKVAIDVAWR